MVNHSERVIVALDVPGEEQALAAVKRLMPAVGYVKVGMELFFAAGPSLVGRLKELGVRVFVDLKIHDIPNTAYGAIRSLSRLGCDMMNVHCSGGVEMLKRAREGCDEDCLLVGVTLLTSLNDEILRRELLVERSIEESVLHYAALAEQAGLDGVVCSPQDAARVKASLGRSFLAITPGVRPTGDAHDDQKRAATPAQAIAAGSDYLVIGRPILQSEDPKKTLEGILAEIEVAG